VKVSEQAKKSTRDNKEQQIASDAEILDTEADEETVDDSDNESEDDESDKPAGVSPEKK